MHCKPSGHAAIPAACDFEIAGDPPRETMPWADGDGDHVGGNWSRQSNAVSRLADDQRDRDDDLTPDVGVADAVDAVTLRRDIAADMIAVAIGPRHRFAVVGSPGYFKIHKRRYRA